MALTIPDDTPWHDLSSQQRKAIDELLRAKFINCGNWTKLFQEFHAFTANSIFIGWTAREKPNVSIKFSDFYEI